MHTPFYIIAFAACFLSGCTTLKPSTPAPILALEGKAPQERCVELRRVAPDPMPGGAVAFPHGAPYVLIPADSAAGLLVPLPFVTDLVTGAMAKSAAADYQQHMAGIDPFAAASSALNAQPALTQGCAHPSAELRAQVFIMESHDKLFRMSLLFEVRVGSWVGRYYDHLPTTLTPDSLVSMPAGSRERLQVELNEASLRLMGLVQRDLSGQLPAHGIKYRAGSLYLVGGNIVGLVAPERLVYPGAELLESDGNSVLLRFAGDVSSPGQAGALLFGVHYFRRDQLHHFERE